MGKEGKGYEEGFWILLGLPPHKAFEDELREFYSFCCLAWVHALHALCAWPNWDWIISIFEQQARVGKRLFIFFFSPWPSLFHLFMKRLI